MSSEGSIDIRTCKSYRISDVAPYINWFYFFHAWGMPASLSAVTRVHNCEGCTAAWISSLPLEMQDKGREALRLYHDAQKMLSTLDAEQHATYALAHICPANSDGEDIIVWHGQERTQLPMLRQQNPSDDGYCYCLSDFIRPLGDGNDTIGIFATSASASIIDDCQQDDPYGTMLRQTLADRLAEATADKFHEEVRRHIWGYAPDECLSIDQLHAEHYQGIRPATGYPSMPDVSVNSLIDNILHLKDIGVTLTESGMMRPHASVCGLMISHPQSRYFSVGLIDERQLRDYAERRGMSADTIRRHLANSI